MAFWNRIIFKYGIRELHVYLIKPTLYDEDGHVVRHWRGVLPSNTLACLAGLTEDAAAHKHLGKTIKIETHVLDETIDRVPVKRICRSQRELGARTVVGLVGVQTNQFSACRRPRPQVPARRIDSDDRRLSRNRLFVIIVGNSTGDSTTDGRRCNDYHGGGGI